MDREFKEFLDMMKGKERPEGMECVDDLAKEMHEDLGTALTIFATVMYPIIGKVKKFEARKKEYFEKNGMDAELPEEMSERDEELREMFSEKLHEGVTRVSLITLLPIAKVAKMKADELKKKRPTQ